MTLVALVIVTVLALVAVRMSAQMLRISGNAQAALEAESAAQFAIDSAIADINVFKNALPPSITRGVSIGSKSYLVTIAPPACLNSVTAPGYSLLYSSPPVDQTWNFAATAVDSSVAGTSVALTQGVKVRMPVGSVCPN
jgi:Tfp pilus assembly protein PilX